MRDYSRTRGHGRSPRRRACGGARRQRGDEQTLEYNSAAQGTHEPVVRALVPGGGLATAWARTCRSTGATAADARM